MKELTHVLAFGAFDPLHEGHRFFLEQASGLGDYLTVVVASDAQIASLKHHDPYQEQTHRMNVVRELPFVDEVVLGDDSIGSYEVLSRIDFAVLAVGYDQRPDDATIADILKGVGKDKVRLVRLDSFEPGLYKSSNMKSLR